MSLSDRTHKDLETLRDLLEEAIAEEVLEQAIALSPSKLEAAITARGIDPEAIAARIAKGCKSNTNDGAHRCVPVPNSPYRSAETGNYSAAGPMGGAPLEPSKTAPTKSATANQTRLAAAHTASAAEEVTDKEALRFLANGKEFTARPEGQGVRFEGPFAHETLLEIDKREYVLHLGANSKQRIVSKLSFGSFVIAHGRAKRSGKGIRFA